MVSQCSRKLPHSIFPNFEPTDGEVLFLISFQQHFALNPIFWFTLRECVCLCSMDLNHLILIAVAHKVDSESPGEYMAVYTTDLKTIGKLLSLTFRAFQGGV